MLSVPYSTYTPEQSDRHDRRRTDKQTMLTSDDSCDKTTRRVIATKVQTKYGKSSHLVVQSAFVDNTPTLPLTSKTTFQATGNRLI